MDPAVFKQILRKTFQKKLKDEPVYINFPTLCFVMLKIFEKGPKKNIITGC